MYKGKKIGVAIATYNGARFIREQLDSIINQTVVPDEIVISDDGSSDDTLMIVNEIANSKVCRDISFNILTDNPRHGIGGNFEWAITHSSCDYIFVCGQDDIWMTEKVQKVIEAFVLHPDAYMICHKLTTIDVDNYVYMDGKYNSLLDSLNFDNSNIQKAECDKFLETTISAPLMSGTAICLSSKLVNCSMPIPVDSAEDQWLQFCAVLNNGLYYLNEVLTKYRIHDSVSHSTNMSVGKKFEKNLYRIKNANCRKRDMVYFAKAVISYLDRLGLSGPEFDSAYGTANRIYEIGQKEIDAAKSGRISGAIKITKLFCTDMRYRRIGAKIFLINLANILLCSKKKRIKDLR